MNATKFYVLLDKDTKGALNATIGLPKVPTLDLFHGKYFPAGILPLTKFCGNRNLDLVNASNGLFLLSNRVIEIFKNNHITGWKSLPAEIHMGKGEIISDYSFLTIISKLVKIDYEKSERVIKQPFTPAGKPIWINRGLPFDINGWDGSDIFSAENSLFTLITEKVQNLLIENKCTNIRVEKTTEIELY
jgi:hypothetical protein